MKLLKVSWKQRGMNFPGEEVKSEVQDKWLQARCELSGQMRGANPESFQRFRHKNFLAPRSLALEFLLRTRVFTQENWCSQGENGHFQKQDLKPSAGKCLVLSQGGSHFLFGDPEFIYTSD